MKPKRIKGTRVSLRHMRAGRRRAGGALLPPKIHVELFPPLGDIVDVPPWGVVVPAEVVEYGMPFHASVRAFDTDIPAGATVVLYWEHKDGTAKEQDSKVYSGEAFVVFELPNAWLTAAIGKPVSLHYEVIRENGDRTPGPALDINMTKFLEIPPVRYDEIGFGEPLDPARFPDAIHATIDRIPNVQSYHEMEFRFLVIGASSGQDGTILHMLTYSLSGIEGGPKTFTIPAESYTGFHDDHYTEISIEAHIFSLMYPEQEQDWVWRWKIGDNLVVPPSL